jgi:mannosyltransferase OCH1-like enzyme
MIPKIIHQTAPKDKNLWHPIWFKCHDSWKEHYPESEYTHIMWNDEDIDNLVKEEFPEYLDLYNSFSFHIIKIDFIRYCILYKYGGIYADMDMFCYKNFYNELEKECYLIGSPFTNEELVQNSLMISTVKNKFFKYCIDEILKTYQPFDNSEIWTNHVVKSCGPRFLSELYLSFEKDAIGILSCEEYNNDLRYYSDNIKTRHMMTGRWGSEMINILKERHRNDKYMKYGSHKEYLMYEYGKFRNINIHNFDFFR